MGQLGKHILGRHHTFLARLQAADIVSFDIYPTNAEEPEVPTGLYRIVALYYSSFTLYHIH
jgi:hypothetical protein